MSKFFCIAKGYKIKKVEEDFCYEFNSFLLMKNFLSEWDHCVYKTLQTLRKIILDFNFEQKKR